MVEILFAGRTVFESPNEFLPEARIERPAEPVFLGYPHGPKTSEFVPSGRTALSRTIQLSGDRFQAVIHGSDESWAVSSASPNLGTQWGGAIAADSDSIYDRKGDWLLRIEGGTVKIASSSKGRFQVIATGRGLKVVFYEHYYRDHLGYFFWNKAQPIWQKPVMGWCSWMAYLQDVNETHMLGASKFFSENLKSYGYNIIQMDDGYQRVPQNDPSGFTTKETVAELWNSPNSKFPSGLDSLAHAILGDGMVPGIWVGLYLPIAPGINGYVTDPSGKPYRGPWVNYAINGFDDESLQVAYLNTFKGLKQKGWQYIKIDTLRHIIYDSYRKVLEYWKARNQSPEEAFRRIVSGVKKVWGKDRYVLACWGAIPELAGIPDGCRIGEDVGPDAASMQRTAKYVSQFHALNNVIWRNDPDYMCFRIGAEMSKTWASLLALTGCQLMVSDPIETYDAERVDILRRVGPTAFLKPTNVSPMPPNPEWAVFHGKTGAEQWTVAGHFAFEADRAERKVPLSEIGLDSSKTYLAFDFWKSEFLGTFSGAAPVSPLKLGHTQVISFREAVGHPQLLGTDRHILQGAVEMEKVKWQAGRLSGVFMGGPGRDWRVFVHVPRGWSPKLESNMTLANEVLTISIPGSLKETQWSVSFGKEE